MRFLGIWYYYYVAFYNLDICTEQYSMLFGDQVKLSMLIIWWEIPLRKLSPFENQ